MPTLTGLLFFQTSALQRRTDDAVRLHLHIMCLYAPTGAWLFDADDSGCSLQLSHLLLLRLRGGFVAGHLSPAQGQDAKDSIAI
jgi:hypothetical protein